MTQKEKDFLLKDLCARLPYGVKVDIPSDYPFNPPILEEIRYDGEIIVDKIRAYDFGYYKPYLRHESSMTDEEKESFHKLKVYNHNDCKDWYNSHHIDDRGLIEKGLALEAPEGMYKKENLIMANSPQLNEQKPITESKRLANEVIEYLTRCGYSPILKDDSEKEHFHIDIPRHEDVFWHSEEYKHCRSVLGEYYMEGDYGSDTYTLYIWRAKKEQKPVDLSEMMVHKEPYIAPVPAPIVADEQKPVEIDEEINRWMGCEAFPEGINITPLPQAMEIVERTAKHFFELGEKTVPSPGGYWEGFKHGVRECQNRIRDIKDTMKEQKPVEYLDKDKVYDIMIKLHDLAFSQRIPINSDEYKKLVEITIDIHGLLDYPIEPKSINESNMHEPTLDEARKWNEAYEKGYSLGYKNGRNEQKPWEWSEEERKILDSIIDDYEKAAKSFCGYDGKIGLLRAIRNGEYDLPKQGWNEEDERIFQHCLVILHDYGYDNWFKSICSKPKHK